MARPSSYDPEVAELICRLIAEGEGITHVCAREGMPSPGTVYRWLEANEEFRQAYARARDQQADRFADEIVRIADEEEDPNRAKVRIDARKWAAAKLAPKKYGDTSSRDVNVTVSVQQQHLDAVRRLAGPVVDVTPVALREAHNTHPESEDDDVN